MNQESHAGNDEQEKCRKRIDQEGKRNLKCSRLNEWKQRYGDRLKSILFYLEENEHTHDKGSQDCTDSQSGRIVISGLTV